MIFLDRILKEFGVGECTCILTLKDYNNIKTYKQGSFMVIDKNDQEE